MPPSVWLAQRLDELEAVVFVHPVAPAAAPALPSLPWPIIDLPHETARTAANLVVSGAKAK